MKTLLRTILMALLILWLTSRLYPGLSVSEDMLSLFILAAVIGLAKLIIVPLLSVIFLPLNILTVGLFRYVIFGVIIYIIDAYTSLISLHTWTLNSFILSIPNIRAVTVPTVDFTYWINLAVLVFIISLSFGFVAWLCDEE